MLTLESRKLANLTRDEIWALPDRDFMVQFDDGMFPVKTRQIIFSWYIWEIHRQFPQTPLLYRHYMGNGHLGNDTHLKLVGLAIWSCFSHYPHMDEINDIERLCKIGYEIVNAIYNDHTLKLEAYVTSISILDFLEVMDHPVIREANSKVRPDNETTEFTITKAYKTIGGVLKDQSQMPENPVAKAARFGLVRMGQVLQCVAPRGYVADIDSNVFRNPILTGFVEGMRNLEDVAKESRSASKALFFSKGPMADSEYFNRNIQLGASTLANLHQGDCGSTDLIQFTVRPGDIEDLLGIYYDNGKGFAPITDNDHHLVGKVIKIRNVFGCRHPDKYGVCATCFGDLAMSIPKYTNIAHFSSIMLQSEIGQRILSTKHEDTSSTVDDIIISEDDKRFIRKGEKSNTLKLADQLVGKEVTMIIPQESAPGLIDLVYVNDIRSLVVSRITDLDVLVFVLHPKEGVEIQVSVNVSSGGRHSSLSHAALEYIKRTKWSMTDNGDYAIDMSGWVNEDALLELPLKHYNMVDFMRAIEGFIKGTARSKSTKPSEMKIEAKTLIDFETPEGALAAFHDLISTKMRLNISHVQTIILSTMIESGANRNFYIPGAGVVGEFNSYRSNMLHRSLAAMMAYEGQAPALLRLESYLIKDRPDHPLDDLLLPM